MSKRAFIRLTPLLILSWCLAAHAADVKLAWDPNGETDLAGYKLHYGTASRSYTTSVNVGNQTTHTVTGLGTGTYYFTVTAYNQASQESPYSNEVVQAVDATSPALTSISVSGVTASAASVAWATNEAANSQVEYGLSTSYGNSTAIDNALVINHSVSLSSLAPATVYHYRVKARDAAGNLAVSGDYTFTTLPPPDTTPPVITAVAASAITASSATISWTTNEPADSRVEYGASLPYSGINASGDPMTTSHSLTISGLSPNTLYHFRAQSRDASGNLGQSSDLTFTTAAAPDTKRPAISSVTAAAITSTGATIAWSTDENADSQVEYGTSTSYGVTVWNGVMTTSHSQSLNGLLPETVYHFRVKSRDAAGNESLSSDSQFSTLSAEAPPPAISAVRSVKITSSGATITWSTDRPATSQVQYGTSRSYGNWTALEATLVQSHSQSLTGLMPATVYYFRVLSSDAAGKATSSAEYSFKTSTGSKVKRRLYYPLTLSATPPVGPGEGDYTGIALANLDSTTAGLTVTAFDAAGKEIAGLGIQNPVARTLEPGAQVPLVDAELFGSALKSRGGPGWIRVESDVSNIVGFFTLFNSEMTVLDGAPSASSALTEFVFPEIEGAGFTTMYFANDGQARADVTLDLVASNGEVRASVARSVEANGALYEDLSGGLFGKITPAETDYIRVRASEPLHAVELFGRSAAYIAGLNGQNVGGATTLYAPQYVTGNGWSTGVSLVNLDPLPGKVAIRLLTDDAMQIGETRLLTVPPHGKVSISERDIFGVKPDAPKQGYLEIVSDGLRLAGLRPKVSRTGCRS